MDKYVLSRILFGNVIGELEFDNRILKETGQ